MHYNLLEMVLHTRGHPLFSDLPDMDNFLRHRESHNFPQGLHGGQ